MLDPDPIDPFTLGAEGDRSDPVPPKGESEAGPSEAEEGEDQAGADHGSGSAGEAQGPTGRPK